MAGKEDRALTAGVCARAAALCARRTVDKAKLAELEGRLTGQREEGKTPANQPLRPKLFFDSSFAGTSEQGLAKPRVVKQNDRHTHDESFCAQAYPVPYPGDSRNTRIREEAFLFLCKPRP